MDQGASKTAAAKYNVNRADTPKNHPLSAGSEPWVNQLGGNLRLRETMETALGINENCTALRERNNDVAAARFSKSRRCLEVKIAS